MHRLVYAASPLLLAALAVPAWADQACSQVDCPSTCPSTVGTTHTVGTTQVSGCATAAAGTAACGSVCAQPCGDCQAVSTAIEQVGSDATATGCPSCTQLTAEHIRLSLLPGIVSGAGVQCTASACQAASESTAVAAVDTGGDCTCRGGSCCAADTAVVAQPADAGSGGPTCHCQTQPVVRAHDVVLRLTSDGPPIPVQPATSLQAPAKVSLQTAGRYQLHVVDNSIYMFDTLSGSLYIPGDQGLWTVRASLVDVSRR